MHHGLVLEQSKFIVMEVHVPHVFYEMAMFRQQEKIYCWKIFLNCDFIDASVNLFVVPLASFSSTGERFADFNHLCLQKWWYHGFSV